ncbi:helicase DnaB [Mycoplasma sp. E35C]|uniref:helicase DnaB n=1 Tax=Mycoplasma sp. E35C TaxID=2801918 RepID=UPI001CA3C8CC|nr:helicase DnaB [Mycoplasma sp. E35C]QZX49345.1 helicase DnaB [Mycoplasma sp. E35C]
MVEYKELYEIHRNAGSINDTSLITNVYLHILGSEATMFYMWLINDYQTYMHERCKKNDLSLSRIFKTLGISKKQLSDFRKLLEGLQLLKTYVETNDVDKTKTYKFFLAKMLDWDGLMSQEIIKTTLINKIGREEYFRLSNLYSNKNIGGSNINVSSTFYEVFKKQNTDIYDHIASNTGSIDLDSLKFRQFNFSPETKNALTSLCEKYNPPESELIEILERTENINDSFDLAEAITEYTNTIDELEDASIPQNMNRNETFFGLFCPKDLEVSILHEYRTFNSERYLRGIYRRNLYPKEVEFIEGLKKEQNNKDYIVNAILDFSAQFSLTNKIQFDYAEKISNTLVIKNIRKLSDVVKYFRKVYSSKQFKDYKQNLSSSTRS